jgi:hypothetical protein
MLQTVVPRIVARQDHENKKKYDFFFVVGLCALLSYLLLQSPALSPIANQTAVITPADALPNPVFLMGLPSFL